MRASVAECQWAWRRESWGLSPQIASEHLCRAEGVLAQGGVVRSSTEVVGKAHLEGSYK